MNEIEKIVDDIKDNNCILFLGPQMPAIAYNGNNVPVHQPFTDYILQEIPEADFLNEKKYSLRNYYYLTGKYINHCGSRAKFEKELQARIKKDFFEKESKIYENLCRLPFNTIINFGYDLVIQEILRKKGVEFSNYYYDYNGNENKNLKDVDDSQLLIYNLLGSIKAPQSLVLTEDDQLEFIKKIIKGPTLPTTLLTRIKGKRDSTRSYIFLGFDFEEWHFRLLLDILELPKEIGDINKAESSVSSITSKLPDYDVIPITKGFYENRFGLNFYNQNPEEFIQLLIKEYERKYGFDKHTNGFISFHEKDEDVFKNFSDKLKEERLGRRIKFWDKTQIIGSQNRIQEITKNLDKSTIYIPLISGKFINNADLNKELRYMLDKNNVLIFPIVIRDCDFESDFPDLVLPPRFQLPEKDTPLITSKKRRPSEDDYAAIIKKINTKIR